MQHGHHGTNGVHGREIEFPHPHAPTAVALRHEVDGVTLRRPRMLFFDRLILRERDPVGRRHGHGAEREDDDARPVRARPFHRARPAAIGRQLTMAVETVLQVRQRGADVARCRIDNAQSMVSPTRAPPNSTVCDGHDWVAGCLIAPVSRTRLRSSGRAQTCSRARCWTARRRRCRCRAASSATSPSRPPARR